MSDLNTLHNRVVWFDIPVADLDRAISFYERVLAIEVDKQSLDGFEFATLAHADGNGGCLVPNADGVSATQGPLIYLNVDGRLEEAVALVEDQGGSVTQSIHRIGP
nr:hypothetical protein [Oceanospirillaceae bacterium]